MSRAQRDHIDAAQTRAIDALYDAASALFDLSHTYYEMGQELRAGHYEERSRVAGELAETVKANRRERRKQLARQRQNTCQKAEVRA